MVFIDTCRVWSVHVKGNLSFLGSRSNKKIQSMSESFFYYIINDKAYFPLGDFARREAKTLEIRKRGDDEERFGPISAFYPYFRIQRFIPVSAFYSHFSVLSSFQRFILISVFYPHFSVLSRFQRFIPISAFYPHFSVLSPFQRFIPISVFYPDFSVLSSFQRFIPISAFYPHFSVLSPFQRFIPISAFYPHFSVLFPFRRFILISASYPHFSFRFQFPFQPFSFTVLSQPLNFLFERHLNRSWINFFSREYSRLHIWMKTIKTCAKAKEYAQHACNDLSTDTWQAKFCRSFI